MLAYSSTYSEVYFDEVTGILMQKWLKKTKKMSDKRFKKEMLAFLNVFNYNKVKYLLIDMLEFNYILSTEMQQWVGREINAIITVKGVHKSAFVINNEPEVEVSVRLTLTDKETLGLNIEFFSDVEMAKNWLLDKL